MEHCCSCGLKIAPHMQEEKDFFLEYDASENYYICYECKKYWDSQNSDMSDMIEETQNDDRNTTILRG